MRIDKMSSAFFRSYFQEGSSDSISILERVGIHQKFQPKTEFYPLKDEYLSIYLPIYLSIYLSICTYMKVQMYKYLCMHIYIYIHIHIHVPIHIPGPSPKIPTKRAKSILVYVLLTKAQVTGQRLSTRNFTPNLLATWLALRGSPAPLGI